MSYKCTRRVASICEYLQVLTGTHRYLQVHKGEKGPKGMSLFLFTFYFLFFILLQSPRRPTAANAGQRRSTQAHSSQQRPMQGPRQPTQANEGHSAAILLHRYVFFNLHFIFCFFITTKPTKAHSSQRRPMQAHED